MNRVPVSYTHLDVYKRQASGDYDAGGTYVPYAYGAADIRARVMDFAGLNRRLNEG